jgi:hypothetical protein
VAAPEDRGPLARERSLLARAKRVTLWGLGQAALRYGKGLAREQEVVGRLADMAIDVYALESAVLAPHVKKAVAASAAPDAAGALATAHAQLRHLAMDTIASRRRIADAIIDADRYPL